MKSDKRHELQTNTLADRIGKGLEDHGSTLKLLLAGGLAVFVGIFAILWLSSARNSSNGALWSLYFFASSAPDGGDALQEITEDFDKRNLSATAPGLWSRQALADLKLGSAAAAMLRDKEQAKKDLQDAADLYDFVRKNAGSNTLLKSRAIFGLAQVKETLCEPKAAKKLYEQVKQAAPGTAIAKAADASIQRVERLEADQWFVWFKDQKPQSGPDPNLPADLGDLPDLPDLSFPKPPEPAKPADEGATPTGDEKTPAEGGPKPSEDAKTPAGDAKKPAGDATKPAGDAEKPAAGGEKSPAADGKKPAAGGEKSPAADGKKPAEDAKKPAAGGAAKAAPSN